MDDDRLEQLGQVASWYYEDNLDQADIAARIGRSSSMVSRMLNEARAQGLIEIRVRYPLKTDIALEKLLCSTFNLSQAYVLASPSVKDYPTTLRRLGRLAARCLQEKLHNDISISVGWGASLHQLVLAMPNMPVEKALVVQIMGASGHADPMIDGGELARWLAEKINADYRLLPAPLIVENEIIAHSLLNEHPVDETLFLADQAQIALVGIGPIDSSLSGLYRTGYFNDADIEAFKNAGVVGDLVGHLLDAEGNLVDISTNRCVISQSLESLRSVPTVIAVAGDVMKAQAIRAALLTGCLDVLVTDAIAARAVLDLHIKQS